MELLRRAKTSPRVENGEIFWYSGDSFRFQLCLELRDPGGLPVNPMPGDSLELLLRDCRGRVRKNWTFTGEALASGVVEPELDEAASRDLGPGGYTFDLILRHGNVTTLVRDNPITVEGKYGR